MAAQRIAARVRGWRKDSVDAAWRLARQLAFAADGENAESMGYHLVRYGLLGQVGRFAAVDAVRYPRRPRVVVRTRAGSRWARCWPSRTTTA